MRHAVVTGANSFVGSSVIHELISHDVHVTALCRKGHTENVPISDLVTIDYFDLSELEKTNFPAADVIFHFAWLGGTKVSSRGNYELQIRNVICTVEILRMAAQAKIKRFVGAGSIMEYETIMANRKPGNRPGMGYIYGTGKLAAHFIAQSIAASESIEFMWPLITNAYGVGEISTRMINTTIRKCLNGEEPQFTDATQMYDFVYIDDVAKAFYAIGEKGKPFTEYVIGSGEAKPLKEYLLELKKIVAPDLIFHFGKIPFSGVDLPPDVWNTKRTVQDTGFEAKVSFSEGIEKTKEYLKGASFYEHK